MKKVWAWVLPIVIGLLLLWTVVRERFVATPSIKAPSADMYALPYDPTETDRIWGMISPANRAAMVAYFRENPNNISPGFRDQPVEDFVKLMVASQVAYFYQTVYAPATTPITTDQVTKFVQDYTSQIVGADKGLAPGLTEVLNTYFVKQSGMGISAQTGYADILTDLGQGPGYLQTAPSPNPPPPTGFYKTGELSPYGGGGYDVPDTGSVPGGGKGTQTGTTTGGTSTSSYGPTSGGVSTGGGTTGGGTSTSSLGPTSGNATASSRSKQVFGPVYTAKGPGRSGNPGDSTKTNQYPELMGGFVDTSTRIPGVGVVAPSKNWLLTMDGSLPSSCSLGSDANSSFFPTSRCPGDMDVIPDPYRLARNYSTATYSSKTEPVPFLTDFSAFLK